MFHLGKTVTYNLIKYSLNYNESGRNSNISVTYNYTNILTVINRNKGNLIKL